MKKLFYFLLLIINIGIAQAQQAYTITGIVTDGADVPIPGATVFLADSRKVTASDSEGKFNLLQVQPGKYTLVVKMIGYVVTTHDFMLQSKDMRFRVKLPEDNIMLNAVEISDMSTMERKVHLQTFLTSFLGISTYAKQCKILNTDDIRLKFDKKKNILTATSNDFLIIENKALGYRMKYLLKNFIYDRHVHNDALISFDGTLFFEDMEGNARQLQKWDKERAKAYLGSSTHFFKAAVNNMLDEEGFVVYRMLNQDAMKVYGSKQQAIPQKYFSPFKGLNGLITDMDENFKIFNTGLLKKDSLDLFVVYTPEKEPMEFKQLGLNAKRTFSMPPGQLSLMQITGDSVLINKNGTMSTLRSVWFTGYWTWGRVAAFMPSDYAIPEGLEPPKIKKQPADKLKGR